jgi:hypothetical protein
MFSKIIVTGTLVAALNAFKPPEVADSVGWKALRTSAVAAFSIPR